MKYSVRIALLVVLAALLAFPVIGQEEVQEQKLLMTYIPNIQFAPMYVAIGEGFFAEAGLDVSLEYLNEPDVVDLVAANEEQFGVVSGEQVILATAQGRPITYVYEWFQQYPIGIVYSSDLEISSVSDLEGLHIGIPGRFGATYTGFTTLLLSADMTETDVELDEIGFSAPEVFCVGAIDASVVYVNNEPIQIRNRAQQGDCGDVTDVAVLSVSDVVDLVSNGIITSQAMIDENPDRVQAMVEAYNTGLQLTINNPARAYLVSAPFIEGLPLDDDFRAALELLADQQDMLLEGLPDMEALYESHDALYAALVEDFDSDTLTQLEVLLASIRLWNADLLGYSDLQSWENMQDTLIALGQLDDRVDLETIFTNDFLSGQE